MGQGKNERWPHEQELHFSKFLSFMKEQFLASNVPSNHSMKISTGLYTFIMCLRGGKFNLGTRILCQGRAGLIGCLILLGPLQYRKSIKKICLSYGY